MAKKRNTAKHSKMRTRLLQNLAKGMNKAEAAKAAGYSHRVAGYNALKRMDLDVGELLDKINLPIIKVLSKLKDKMEAKETLFFQKDGIVMETRTVVAHDIQLRAAVELARLIGLYPRNGHSGPDNGGDERDRVPRISLTLAFDSPESAKAFMELRSSRAPDHKLLEVDAASHEHQGRSDSEPEL